jgi:Flp pilus assembly protein TadB
MIYVLSFVRNAQQTRQSNVLESLLSVVVRNLKINRVQKADTTLKEQV